MFRGLVLLALMHALLAVPIVTTTSVSPKLYVTFHGGSHSSNASNSNIDNILAYNLDGVFIGSVVGDDTSLDQLRSMTALSNGHVLVANSFKKDSKIVELGQCELDGTRSIVGVLVQPTPEMVHPYGVAVSPDGLIYTSNQDDKVAVSIFNSDGTPAKSPSGGDDGSFVELNADGKSRGLAYDSGRLFLCREDKDDVHVFDASNATIITKIEVSKPVGVTIDLDSNLILVGSNDATKPQICMFDLSDFSLKGCVSTGTFTHPAGIAVHAGKVYFNAQDQMALVSFPLNLSLQNTPLTELAKFEDTPEGLFLSPC